MRFGFCANYDEKLFRFAAEAGFDGNMIIEHEDPIFHGARREEGLRLGLKHLKRFVVSRAGASRNMPLLLVFKGVTSFGRPALRLRGTKSIPTVDRWSFAR